MKTAVLLFALFIAGANAVGMIVLEKPCQLQCELFSPMQSQQCVQKCTTCAQQSCNMQCEQSVVGMPCKQCIQGCAQQMTSTTGMGMQQIEKQCQMQCELFSPMQSQQCVQKCTICAQPSCNMQCEQNPTGISCKQCIQGCAQQMPSMVMGMGMNSMEQTLKPAMTQCAQRCALNAQNPGLCLAECTYCFQSQCLMNPLMQCEQQQGIDGMQCQQCQQQCARQSYASANTNKVQQCQQMCFQNAQNGMQCNAQCLRCYNQNCTKCGMMMQLQGDMSSMLVQQCNQCAQNCAQQFLN